MPRTEVHVSNGKGYCVENYNKDIERYVSIYRDMFLLNQRGHV